MNDFNKFLEVPNKEISSRTHILEEFIVHIKNKDYDKMKVKPFFHGFIQSISSEYDFDLRFMLDEYKEFHNLNGAIENSLEIENMEEVVKEDDIFIDPKEDNTNYLSIIFVIFGLVVVMFWFIFKENSKVEEKSLMVKQKTMKQSKEKINKNTKQDKKVSIKEKKKKEINKGKKHNFNVSNAKKIYKLKDNMLLVEPFKGNTLWIGIIDLHTKKQVGNIVRGLTSYKVKPNTIILTGHGYLNFIDNINNKSIEHRTYDKLFFYYKNESLYQLKKKDVLALNGGFIW